MKYRIVKEKRKFKIQYREWLFWWRDYKQYADFPEPRFKTYVSTKKNCAALIEMLKNK